MITIVMIFTVRLIRVVNDENLFLHHVAAVNAPLSDDDDDDDESLWMMMMVMLDDG